MALSRRDFIKVSAFAAGAGAVSPLGVALREPHEPVVNHIPVILDRLPSAFDGFRIAQLSDIHFNSFMTPEHLQSVLTMVKAQKPDVVMLTGDFVTAHHQTRRKDLEAARRCAAILHELQLPLGTFAVLGNHDCEAGADAISEALRSAGVQVLRNQAHTFERDGARIHLAGIDSVTDGWARADKALRGVPQSECCVAAVHEPDYADELRKFAIDFQMSGHSHGGQIRLPVAGAVVLPEFARKYPKGSYRLGKLQLYTNSGIGVIGLPMRFLCPPEISVFDLKTPGASKA